jgi:hypothetical protein
MMAETKQYRYSGRYFSGDELEAIRTRIKTAPNLNRWALSIWVCEQFGWRKPDGGLKDMSCRVALLRMEKDGLLRLPPPQRRNGNGKCRPKQTTATDPQPIIRLPAGKLGPPEFKIVNTKQDSQLWNEYIERYHYLGYQPLPGAQLRYFVYANQQLVALLGFGAAAWSLAPRDRWIGWSASSRKENLHQVVNNARFLILPWIESKNLASRILGRVSRRLASDWKARYQYEPLLMETFIDAQRFRGTCYRAANWQHLGQTKGRGKKGPNKPSCPIKDIWVYPLASNFREFLL